MTMTSEKRKNPLQIVSTIEGDELAAARVPVRRILGSTGTSILIHFLAMLVLSLIALAQQNTSPPLAIDGD